jgi:thiol-disulfide isomerase/thioredoxin
MKRAIACLFLQVLLGATDLPAVETSIHGKLSPSSKSAAIELLRLDRRRYRHEDVATTEAVQGEFTFRFAQDEPGIYRLKLPGGKRLDIAIRPGQELQLRYDLETGELDAQGSRDSTEFLSGVGFNALYIREHLAPLSKGYSAASKKGDAEEIQQARRALLDAKKIWFTEFVRLMATLDSPIAVYGLFTMYDWNSQVGDYDLSAIEAIHKEFQQTHPDAPETTLLGDVIRRYRGTAIGSILPDHPFPDANGNITRVSDLRGKHVLVEIWASWCVPCRKEAPNMVANYEKYRGDGFSIYSVSFDDDKKKWLKAIKKDGRNWPHQVSDLKGSHSEATYAYCAAPPGSFLLDPEGRILAKNLKGDVLGSTLEEIFGH